MKSFELTLLCLHYGDLLVPLLPREQNEAFSLWRLSTPSTYTMHLSWLPLSRDGTQDRGSQVGPLLFTLFRERSP